MTLKRPRSSSPSPSSSSTLPASLSSPASSAKPPPLKILKLSPLPSLTPTKCVIPDEKQAIKLSRPTSALDTSSPHPNHQRQGCTYSCLAKDHLSTLSDELLIRILHHLPVECVLLCSLVSRKFRRLSADAQVWKGLYYGRFVRPRALRIPSVAGPSRSRPRLEGEDAESGDGRELKVLMRSTLPSFDSRKSKWLDEVGLLDAGDEIAKDVDGGVLPSSVVDWRGRRRKVTDWKARYKLRHNWSIGAAEVTEIGIGVNIDGDVNSTTEDEDINDEPIESRSQSGGTLMASLVDGMVVTVDSTEGLRAWDIKTKECLAQCPLTQSLKGENEVPLQPTSLAVDTGSGNLDGIGIVVGSKDGGFGVWTLVICSTDGKGSFKRRYWTAALDSQSIDEYGRLDAVAYAHPHLLTITADHILSLYVFEEEADPKISCDTGDLSKVSKHSQPRLLASLKSHTSWPPVSLSIRSTPLSIIASIAYAIPAYLSGWSVGLQELHLTPSGTMLQSRLASAVGQGFQSLLSSSSPSSPASRSPRSASSERTMIHDRGRRDHSGRSPPISLSYSHPYLLAGNRDNTLSLYLVTSNNEELKISKSTTLWGHTSSVASASVGGRGKAVSVSAKGGELRVWELERGLGRKMVGERSVRVRSENNTIENADGSDAYMKTALEAGEGDANQMLRRGWVGFNDEVVIVLRDEEAREGGRATGTKKTLVVYDFS